MMVMEIMMMKKIMTTTTGAPGGGGAGAGGDLAPPPGGGGFQEQRSGTTPSLPTCGAELHTGVLACLHAWLHASTRMLFARAFFRTLTSGFLACFPCRPRKKSKRWASIKTFFSPAGKETPVASASSTTTAPVVSSDCQNPPIR